MRELNKRYWPYKVKPDYNDDKITNAFKWCSTSLPGKDRWRLVGANSFYFRDKKDATLFSMGWL